MTLPIFQSQSPTDVALVQLAKALYDEDMRAVLHTLPFAELSENLQHAYLSMARRAQLVLAEQARTGQQDVDLDLLAIAAYEASGETRPFGTLLPDVQRHHRHIALAVATAARLDELHDARQERNRAEAKVNGLADELANTKNELALAKAALAVVRTPQDGVWLWQGDGSDRPETLTCPVVMSAETLRGYMNTLEAEKAVRTKLESEIEARRQERAEAMHRMRTRAQQLENDLAVANGNVHLLTHALRAVADTLSRGRSFEIDLTRIRELLECEDDLIALAQWISNGATVTIKTDLGDAVVKALRAHQRRIGCSYCGWRETRSPVAPDDEVLALMRAHVETCPKHPMREMEQRITGLEKCLREAGEEIRRGDAQRAELELKLAGSGNVDMSRPAPGESYVSRQPTDDNLYHVTIYSNGIVHVCAAIQTTPGWSKYTVEEFFATFRRATREEREQRTPKS